MAEYQVTLWRDLPSLVVARDPDAPAEVVKVSLDARFQEAIDEAAMRLGEVDADAYLMGWTRSPWTVAEGAPSEVAERVADDLRNRWDPAAITAYLAGLTGG